MTTIKNKPISNKYKPYTQKDGDRLEAKVQKTKWEKKAEAYARKK